MEDLAPVFVKIDEYKEILDIIDVIKEKTAKAKETIGKINELKSEEDKEIELWSKNLDVITKNIADINKTLFESSK